MTDYDVVVCGGGQAGLALGYYLRRTQLRWLILDGEEAAGGAWRHGWDSLHLFSPAEWSSLPGWRMPASAHSTPSRDEVIAYCAAYEARSHLPLQPFARFLHAGDDLTPAAGPLPHPCSRSFLDRAQARWLPWFHQP